MEAKVCEYFWGDFLGTEIWENFGAISRRGLAPPSHTSVPRDIPSGEEGGGGSPLTHREFKNHNRVSRRRHT